MGVRHSVKNILNDILIKNIDSKVKIIHEAIPELYLNMWMEAPGTSITSQSWPTGWKRNDQEGN
jgi:hypothetical protein